MQDIQISFCMLLYLPTKCIRMQGCTIHLCYDSHTNQLHSAQIKFQDLECLRLIDVYCLPACDADCVCGCVCCCCISGEARRALMSSQLEPPAQTESSLSIPASPSLPCKLGGSKSGSSSPNLAGRLSRKTSGRLSQMKLVVPVLL